MIAFSVGVPTLSRHGGQVPVGTIHRQVRGLRNGFDIPTGHRRLSHQASSRNHQRVGAVALPKVPEGF